MTLLLPEHMPALPGYPRSVIGEIMPPVPRKVYADEQSCQLVAIHKPLPIMIEHHHQKPVYLQNRLYGKIVYGPSLWLCGTCHDSVHAWLYFFMGERREPPRSTSNARYEAERTYQWFKSEQQRLGLT